jgi:hypothetical protein
MKEKTPSPPLNLSPAHTEPLLAIGSAPFPKDKLSQNNCNCSDECDMFITAHLLQVPDLAIWVVLFEDCS